MKNKTHRNPDLYEFYGIDHHEFYRNLKITQTAMRIFYSSEFPEKKPPFKAIVIVSAALLCSLQNVHAAVIMLGAFFIIEALEGAHKIEMQQTQIEFAKTVLTSAGFTRVNRELIKIQPI